MTKKMKAAVITDTSTIEFQEFDRPKIGPHEVLYKLKATSLCTVEQRAFSGAKFFGFPLLGGHETAGVVVEVGADVLDFEVGDHVVSTYNYCGHCEYCKLGKGTQCKYGTKSKKRVQDFPGGIIGGGLAQYLAVQAQQIIKVNKEVPFEYYALTEPLACCVHSIEKARISFGETVVVIGGGIMGLFHARLAHLRGARVILSEPDAKRREKALKIGVDIVIDPLSENVVEVAMKYTGDGADVVVNTTPITGIWEDAMSMLAPYGRLIAYSSQDKPEPVEVSFEEIHNKEFELIGTVSPSMASNYQATKLIEYGLVDMEAFIDSRYDYEDAQAAFERAITPNTYRVIINIDR